MFYSHKKQSEGFTLIELLVVVAIISLIASVIMAGLDSARIKARDARRKSELKQVQIALESYHNEFNSYPSNGRAWMSSETGDQATNNSGNWIPGLTPTHMSSLPKDPRGGTSQIQPTCNVWKSAFLYSSDGVNYKLLSHCAPENSWTSGDSFYDPARPTWAWMVCSGEPACSTW